VAGKSRDRRRQPSRQRQAALAAAAARQRALRRRIFLGIGVLVVLIVVPLVLWLSSGDKKKNVKASSSSTTTAADVTTAPPAASVAGKPCVAVSDPLPAGAPAVPVKVGPPPTTLVKEDLKQGTGAVVAASDTVTVNYIGVSCSTGKIFDSSYKTGQPATFPLSGVIKGWTDGIPGMKVGGQRLLGIPPDQAYGNNPTSPLIGPGETLWFVVEVTAATPS
jgi:peptidylprolyl isomerase